MTGLPMLDIDSAIGFAHAADEGRRLADALRGKQPLFVCVIASTDTALIPGISAAGVSQDLIRFTAAADAEFVVHGAARCLDGVPSNPLGPPGPALIARAALELASIPRVVVNAGCRIRPDAPCIELGTAPGGCISEGNAVAAAADLFHDGEVLGARLGAETDYLVVGESVPGGTTTALALLLALGVAADGRVSSSLMENAHALKSRVARQALAHLGPGVAHDPLAAVAILGDPMQAAAAGIAAGALSADCPVLLAGGTQMIAVLALLQRLTGVGSWVPGAGGRPTPDTRHLIPPPAPTVAVATTRWVVDDPLSDATGLIAELGSAPLLTTTLSFAASRYPLLRRYEDFLVKEGVGAGGCAVAAALAADISPHQIADRVEDLYADIINASQVAPGERL